MQLYEFDSEQIVDYGLLSPGVKITSFLAERITPVAEDLFCLENQAQRIIVTGELKVRNATVEEVEIFNGHVMPVINFFKNTHYTRIGIVKEDIISSDVQIFKEGETHEALVFLSIKSTFTDGNCVYGEHFTEDGSRIVILYRPDNTEIL
ncbi:hypothetical protein KNT64_gp021 [Pseudomonas phage PspYZU05]|uniref:Uncharacterized protein n=1 Tax=Pseudomonas phage PspYZU05 TaxID=1983556 RepID=A0A2U7N877_9CAUD|nr:hypothetical protein KNT64_gp021 [Pseudomonas phage PspYZU05]ASD51973.1 hypothetical protein PspYZU05_21 [Pseudomonas phage PspYZU05]